MSGGEHINKPEAVAGPVLYLSELWGSQNTAVLPQPGPLHLPTGSCLQAVKNGSLFGGGFLLRKWSGLVVLRSVS